MFSVRIDDETQLGLLDLSQSDQACALLRNNLDHLHSELTWLNDSLFLSDTREYIQAGLDRYTANNGLCAGKWHRNQLTGIVSMLSVTWVEWKNSLGYWLGESFQSNRLVTRAYKGMIQRAFENMKLHQIEIRYASDNLRSLKVADRLDFTREEL